jgi:uncharacterized membrane protein
MKSRAAIAGHPLHPIFVCIPIGLWCFAPVCDLVYHVFGGDNSWKLAALYCIAGGIVGAVPAIITGWIDYGLVREPKAARVAKFHLILNLLSLPVFGASVWLRIGEVPPNYSLLPVFISLVGVIAIGISGWLGGELVVTHHISVHERKES